MLKISKKILGYMLSFMMVFSCVIIGDGISVNAGNLSEAEFANKIAQLKTVYRDGEYWNGYNDCGYDGTGPKKCSCSASCAASCSDNCGKFYLNGVKYGGQCYGFANKMGYLVFGSIPSANWTKSNSVSEYYAGDHVRVRNDHHSIFITKVSGDTVTYVDCNNAGPCMVKWDRTITVASLKSITSYVFHLSGNTLKGTGTPYVPDDGHNIVWTKDGSYPTPFQAYPANGSSKTNVYNDKLVAYNQNTRHIAPGDLCIINTVYTNGYCEVTYPTSSGNHTEFAKTSDFIPNAVQKYTYSPSQNLTSYTRSDLAVKFGSVFTTDKCTVVGKSGNRIQLIYPGTGGNKLGWVDPPVDPGPSDFKTPLYSYNASSTDMTMVYQYLSTLGGTVYGKIFVDDKCTLNTVNVGEGWINVTYPAGNSTKTGFVYLSEFIPSDSRLNTFYQAKVSQQTDTFRKRDMSVNYGYVSVGDTITVVGKSGDKLQICYPLDSGGWKLAWIYNYNVIKDLKEIYVATNPSKTTYLEGENFNSSGLVINARYTDGSTANVTSSCSLNGYNSSPGTKTITASYNGKSTAFTVVVNKKSLTGISIISNPSKTSYYENENINLSGLQVRASFNNNTTANLGTSDYYVDTNNITSSVGNKNVTVFYEFNGVSKSASFGISVSHNIGDWTITKNATCTETGTKVKKCKVCGYVSETQTIAVTGHSYTIQVVAPTCTAQGYTNHTCSKCGHNYKDTYTNITSHNYGAWTVTKNATCTEKGSQTRKCQTCGHTETTEIAATGHSYTTKVVAPTCTAQGYTLHTCSKCGNNYKDTYTNVTNHNYGAWTVTKNATCTEKGSKTRKCQTCGHEETTEITATGHSYTTKVVAPTCTAQGYTLHTCSKCGNNYKDTYTNATGHNFGAWTVIKNATCTEKGSKTRKCQNCSHTETADIAATGHKYTEKVISPTETENGYTLHTCSVCGDSYQSDITDPLGPPDPNAPSIVVGQKSAIQGQTVTVDISMKNNPGIVGFKIDISYDKDVLTLQNAETIGFDAMYSESMTAMPFTVSWESGFQDVTLNGEIIRLTFAVNEKAADGSYPVTVSYQPDDIYNLKEENIHFAVINGSVEVKKASPVYQRMECYCCGVGC